LMNKEKEVEVNKNMFVYDIWASTIEVSCYVILSCDTLVWMPSVKKKVKCE
jgi:hypothetical protein